MKLTTVFAIFIGFIIGLLAFLIVVEEIFFNTKPKEGLLLSATREGSLGGIWLGVYEDKHFELGSSQAYVNTTGVYTFENDTLKLVIHKGNTRLGNNGLISFVIKDGVLTEISKPSHIKFLGIIKNELSDKSH